MKIEICSLIKFGEKVHMESFYKKGIMFMNHLNSFRYTEDEHLRGDKNEALHEQREVKNIEINLGNNKIGVAKEGRFQLWHDNPTGNIFSMYALKTTQNLNDIKIDDACKKFGDTCVFILDIKEFISRVSEAAQKAGFELVYSPVEYIDLKAFYGKWSPFKKPIQYSYQSEFRFLIQRNDNEPIFLDVGPLEDIAAIAASDHINTLKITKA